MIHHIKGKITHKDLSYVVIENIGIGYLLFIPLSTYDKLGNVGSDVNLLVQPIIREDDIKLYGFLTSDERQIFNLVISVSGISTKLGIAILSFLPISSFIDAILTSDIKLLSKINGIGKKIAERMVLELKDKFNKLSFQVDVTKIAGQNDQVIQDSYLALESLGFRIDLVRKVVQKAYKELNKAHEKTPTSEAIIKYALQELNK